MGSPCSSKCDERNNFQVALAVRGTGQSPQGLNELDRVRTQHITANAVLHAHLLFMHDIKMKLPFLLSRHEVTDE